MTINCIIVDDEPLALDLLEDFVRKTPFLNLVGRYGSAFEALETIRNNNAHLVFLDIQMPDLNGLEFSGILPAGTRVIFTTAFREYALEGFRADALDYLLKPFDYKEFLAAANKALDWFELREKGWGNAEEQSIFVKSEYRIVRIMLSEILYIEGLKDYAKIYLEGAVKPVMSIITLKSLAGKLPAKSFMRVHRSYIVHLNKITTIERNRIVFGNKYIPVSDKYKKSFDEFVRKKFL